MKQRQTPPPQTIQQKIAKIQKEARFALERVKEFKPFRIQGVESDLIWHVLVAMNESIGHQVLLLDTYPEEDLKDHHPKGGIVVIQIDGTIYRSFKSTEYERWFPVRSIDLRFGGPGKSHDEVMGPYGRVLFEKKGYWMWLSESPRMQRNVWSCIRHESTVETPKHGSDTIIKAENATDAVMDALLQGESEDGESWETQIKVLKKILQKPEDLLTCASFAVEYAEEGDREQCEKNLRWLQENEVSVKIKKEAKAV